MTDATERMIVLAAYCNRSLDDVVVRFALKDYVGVWQAVNNALNIVGQMRDLNQEERDDH